MGGPIDSFFQKLSKKRSTTGSPLVAGGGEQCMKTSGLGGRGDDKRRASGMAPSEGAPMEIDLSEDNSQAENMHIDGEEPKPSSPQHKVKVSQGGASPAEHSALLQPLGEATNLREGGALLSSPPNRSMNLEALGSPYEQRTPTAPSSHRIDPPGTEDDDPIVIPDSPGPTPTVMENSPLPSASKGPQGLTPGKVDPGGLTADQRQLLCARCQADIPRILQQLQQPMPLAAALGVALGGSDKKGPVGQKQVVATLTEGRTEGLSTLVEYLQTVVGQKDTDPSSSMEPGTPMASAEAIRMMVVDLATRKTYGLKEGSEPADAFEDSHAERCWYWELRELKGLHKPAKEVADTMRKRRKQLQDHLRCLHNVQTLLSSKSSSKTHEQKLSKALEKLDKLPALDLAEARIALEQVAPLPEEVAGNEEEKLEVEQLRKQALAEKQAEKERQKQEKEQARAERERLREEKERERQEKEKERAEREKEKEEEREKRRQQQEEKKKQEEARKKGFKGEQELKKSQRLLQSFAIRTTPPPDTVRRMRSQDLGATTDPALQPLFSFARGLKRKLQLEDDKEEAEERRKREKCEALDSKLKEASTAEDLLKEFEGISQTWKTTRSSRKRLPGVPPTWARKPSATLEYREMMMQRYGREVVEPAPPMYRRKLLWPDCNAPRPAYYGSFSRKSEKVTGRRPLSEDPSLDYEVMSDEDWEEEPEGESLSVDEEGEEEEIIIDDDEEEDGFLVGDGYLSDDEGVKLSMEGEEDETGDGGDDRRPPGGGTGAGGPRLDPRLQQLQGAVERASRTNRHVVLCLLPDLSWEPSSNLPPEVLMALEGEILNEEASVYCIDDLEAQARQKEEESKRAAEEARQMLVDARAANATGGQSAEGALGPLEKRSSGLGQGAGRPRTEVPTELVPVLVEFLSGCNLRGIDKVVSAFLELHPDKRLTKAAVRQKVKEVAEYRGGRWEVVRPDGLPGGEGPVSTPPTSPLPDNGDGTDGQAKPTGSPPPHSADVPGPSTSPYPEEPPPKKARGFSLAAALPESSSPLEHKSCPIDRLFRMMAVPQEPSSSAPMKVEVAAGESGDQWGSTDDMVVDLTAPNGHEAIAPLEGANTGIDGTVADTPGDEKMQESLNGQGGGGEGRTPGEGLERRVEVSHQDEEQSAGFSTESAAVNQLSRVLQEHHPQENAGPPPEAEPSHQPENPGPPAGPQLAGQHEMGADVAPADLQLQVDNGAASPGQGEGDDPSAPSTPSWTFDPSPAQTPVLSDFSGDIEGVMPTFETAAGLVGNELEDRPCPNSPSTPRTASRNKTTALDDGVSSLPLPLLTPASDGGLARPEVDSTPIPFSLAVHAEENQETHVAPSAPRPLTTASKIQQTGGWTTTGGLRVWVNPRTPVLPEGTLSSHHQYWSCLTSWVVKAKAPEQKELEEAFRVFDEEVLPSCIHCVPQTLVSALIKTMGSSAQSALMRAACARCLANAVTCLRQNPCPPTCPRSPLAPRHQDPPDGTISPSLRWGPPITAPLVVSLEEVYLERDLTDNLLGALKEPAGDSLEKQEVVEMAARLLAALVGVDAASVLDRYASLPASGAAGTPTSPQDDVPHAMPTASTSSSASLSRAASTFRVAIAGCKPWHLALKGLLKKDSPCRTVCYVLMAIHSILCDDLAVDKMVTDAGSLKKWAKCFVDLSCMTHKGVSKYVLMNMARLLRDPFYASTLLPPSQLPLVEPFGGYPSVRTSEALMEMAAALLDRAHDAAGSSTYEVIQVALEVMTRVGTFLADQSQLELPNKKVVTQLRGLFTKKMRRGKILDPVRVMLQDLCQRLGEPLSDAASRVLDIIDPYIEVTT